MRPCQEVFLVSGVSRPIGMKSITMKGKALRAIANTKYYYYKRQIQHKSHKDRNHVLADRAAAGLRP